MTIKPAANVLPVLALLAAATFWGIVWYPLRWLDTQGINGVWSTFLLFATALIAGLPWLWRGRHDIIKHPLLLACIALANGWCNTSFILAVLDGTVVRVMLLFYLSPVWAVLLGRIILGERLPPLGLLTLSLALCGSMIILWDPALGLPWPSEQADWLAISSGLTFALSNVLVRKAEGVRVTVKTVITWVGVTSLTGGILLTGGMAPPAWDVHALGVAVALGLFGMALMTVLLVYGVTHMPVHRSSTILLFEVLAGAVSAAWWANEYLGWAEWSGGALILLAAWVAGRQQHR